MKARLVYNLIVILLISIPIYNGCSHSESFDKPYNILWIVADDLGTDLGCYGTSKIYTPNLDKLASESVLYTNMHTVSAVCSPSRSALITGMYPVSINCHQHRTQYKKPLPPDIKPITEYFKEAGYYVTNGDYRDWSKKGKTDYNFKYVFDSLYDGTDWRQRREDQPFFAQVQIYLPHRPFYRDTLNPINPHQLNIPPYYPDNPVIRKDWAIYMETIQLLDIEVGKVLNRLENDGLANNTIVFFFGDQGRPHLRAKQFLYDPGTNSPLMVRFPSGYNAGTLSDKLVSNIDISAATLHLAGINLPVYMQGLDFLDKSVDRPHLFSMRDRRDETVDKIRALRTKEFKYIRNYYPDRPYTQSNYYKRLRYPALTLMKILYKRGELNESQSRFMKDTRPHEELYSLKNDPFEITNLAEDPEYDEQLIQMRNILETWIEECDKGVYPEDSAEIEYAKRAMYRDYWIPNIKKRELEPDVSDEQLLEYWVQYLSIDK